jgi:hypothetical protein
VIASKLDLPDNITFLSLPSKSPKFNPVENIRQYMRGNRFSNCVFGNSGQIVTLCCEA